MTETLWDVRNLLVGKMPKVRAGTEKSEFCLVGVKGSLRQPVFSPSGLQVERERWTKHTLLEERNTEGSLSHLIVDIKHSLLDLLIDLLGCVDECL